MTFKNFVFIVGANDVAPAGSGDAGTWLRHYKLAAEDEVFIPWDRKHGVPKVGDVLWMQINASLVGMVAIERVFEDELNDRLELWFSGPNIRHCENMTSTLLDTGPVPEGVAETWLNQRVG